jgi:hypothetical protein
MNLVLGRLDEQQRRWYVAVEAKRLGHGGVHWPLQITGLDEKAIQRRQQQLEQGLTGRPSDQLRVACGGRPLVEERSDASRTNVLSEIRDRGVVVSLADMPVEPLAVRDNRTDYTVEDKKDQ